MAAKFNTLNHTLLFHRLSRTYSSVLVAVNANDVLVKRRDCYASGRTTFKETRCCVPFAFISLPTLSDVTRVESVLLRPGPHADAEQPGQDDKREEHGRESQGDLL